MDCCTGPAVAAAVVDGIGHGSDVVEAAGLMAQVSARMAARRGVTAAMLTAGDLISQPGQTVAAPDVVGVVAMVPALGNAQVAWVGDCEALGWDGTSLTRYTTRATLGQQMLEYGALEDTALVLDDVVRTSYARITPVTVWRVVVPDPSCCCGATA
jgi:serine/threonine protein phosphatase PrpC